MIGEGRIEMEYKVDGKTQVLIVWGKIIVSVLRVHFHRPV